MSNDSNRKFNAGGFSNDLGHSAGTRGTRAKSQTARIGPRAESFAAFAPGTDTDAGTFATCAPGCYRTKPARSAD